jgi:hypothetical protein
MKKPFKHTERNSDVLCANPKCAEVRGRAGTERMPIKKNVIARAPEGQTTFHCYDCEVFGKTGMDRKTRKERERARRAKKVEPKVLTAGEEV